MPAASRSRSTSCARWAAASGPRPSRLPMRAPRPWRRAMNEMPPVAVKPATGRARAVALILAAFAIAGTAYGGYWLGVARYVETTDDAYVGGNVVRITPQVSATVIGI